MGMENVKEKRVESQAIGLGKNYDSFPKEEIPKLKETADRLKNELGSIRRDKNIEGFMGGENEAELAMVTQKLYEAEAGKTESEKEEVSGIDLKTYEDLPNTESKEDYVDAVEIQGKLKEFKAKDDLKYAEMEKERAEARQEKAIEDKRHDEEVLARQQKEGAERRRKQSEEQLLTARTKESEKKST